MNKTFIKKSYLETINKLKKYNQAYYEKNSPIISDQQYDIVKKKIIDLENKHKFLKNKESPTLSVGFRPSKILKR